MRKKIAITGGIGSGKSLAAGFVAEMGYPIFSCDEINRDLWKDPKYIQKIKTAFPECIDGENINITLLKTVVFSDKDALLKLNAIAHPNIMERLFKAMDTSEGELIFAEVPLLFEGNYEKNFDEIIVITRSLDERIRAIKARDGLDEQAIKKRINAQFDYNLLEKRIQNINAHVIDNNEDVLSLKNKICSLIQELK